MWCSIDKVLAVDLFLDLIGLRVGAGNLAMPKVTVMSTMVAAVASGTFLGVVFTRFHREHTLSEPQSPLRESADILIQSYSRFE